MRNVKENNNYRTKSRAAATTRKQWWSRVAVIEDDLDLESLFFPALVETNAPPPNSVGA